MNEQEPNWDEIEAQAKANAEAMREDELDGEVVEEPEPEKVEQAVERRREPEQGVAPSRDQAVERGSEELVRFVSDLRLAYNASLSLTTTNFVPGSFKGRPDQAAAAIVTGLELGLTPMAALRSIDIIQGTPALRANTLRAIALAKGHEVWIEESTSQRAIVKGRRRGSDRIQESVWDMDRARQLGLVSKDNWKKQPQAMLIARATTELVRLIAADDILGLSYTAEELDDDGPTSEAAPVKRSTSKVQRKSRSVTPKPTEKPQEPAQEAEQSGADQSPAEEVSVAPEGLDGFADLPDGFQ
ncbi:hypothetical protein [Gulosibacter molinativorax]|uniref:DUF222 domain-containing protein n=1 Tax=Gulosibacter molinativorax TaxID=256821 RepID=A0ABT7CAI1_9MICO|nr:hypothetical protein [Gulosibacter molinativorax]MDJ1371772.1 hypothetical protein [Gulosibacter molinativorax]QUY60858.1 Hypotetical protein [Gulosibacter molinativorax]